MADFKIKSAAGTGNKTLIQGQDQSGSNYAIEIGDAGALKLTTPTINSWSGCRVYLNSTQTITNASTTLVQFAHENYDNLGEFNTSTYTFTATQAGTYLLGVTLQFVDMADTKDIYAYIDVNGTTVSFYDHKSSSANYESTATHTIWKLSASDLVKFYTRHAHGSDRSLASGSSASHAYIQRIS